MTKEVFMLFIAEVSALLTDEGKISIFRGEIPKRAREPSILQFVLKQKRNLYVTKGDWTYTGKLLDAATTSL